MTVEEVMRELYFLVDKAENTDLELNETEKRIYENYLYIKDIIKNEFNHGIDVNFHGVEKYIFLIEGYPIRFFTSTERKVFDAYVEITKEYERLRIGSK